MSNEVENPELNAAATMLLVEAVKSAERLMNETFPSFGMTMAHCFLVEHGENPHFQIKAEKYSSGCSGKKIVSVSVEFTSDVASAVELFSRRVREACECDDPETIKAMAIKIIEVTYDKGQCTDRDLRLFDFPKS